MQQLLKELKSWKKPILVAMFNKHCQNNWLPGNVSRVARSLAGCDVTMGLPLLSNHCDVISDPLCEMGTAPPGAKHLDIHLKNI